MAKPRAHPDPSVGQPLPRAADAYTSPQKWQEWILADRGHGPEWRHVFDAQPADAERIWRAIADAVLYAPIHKILDRGAYGTVCGVDLTLTVGLRAAGVRTSWHYEHFGAAPRLVTAYPRL